MPNHRIRVKASYCAANAHVFVSSDFDQRAIRDTQLPHTQAVTDADTEAEVRDDPLQKTVLVAEDETGVRNFVSHGLRIQGYRVLCSGNGLQALQLSERHRGRIDALVTDLMMPYLGGVEVATRLTAIRPGLKVLYMSGCLPEGFDAAEFRTSGRVLLEKPFTLDQLWRKLRETLDRVDEQRSPQ